MYTRILGFVLMGLSLFSCNSPSVLKEVSFSKSCWNMGDTLTWSPNNSLAAHPSLFVEFTDDYSYRNLFVKVQIETPDGAKSDSLWQAVVVDSLGYWIPPVVGNQHIRYVFPQVFWEQEEFPARVKVVHYMRDSLLCGIDKVGILKRGKMGAGSEEN